MTTPLTVCLPPTVNDDSVGIFIIQLMGAEKAAPSRLILDFQDMRFYAPAALTVLLSLLQHWKRLGIDIEFVNLDCCPILSYLQRMDFLALSGIALAENFRRHDASGRFVPLCKVETGLTGSVSRICSDLAGCVFPELTGTDDPEKAGPFDMLEYAASELINNVIQHARGSGFVSAQAYPHSGFVRLAVADAGIGIRGSFDETKPDFWDAKMSHLDAVRTALQPKVSSKMHLSSGWGGAPVNAGVGLSMLKEVARHTDGIFTLISGDGMYQYNHHEKRSLPTELVLPHAYPGTLCALQISKQKLGNLQQILQDAKKGIGLIQPEHRFDNLFT